MSYNVQLYRNEVKEKELNDRNADFFENEDNLLSFTPTQKASLTERLLKYGYVIEKEAKDMVAFRNENEDDASALLTDRALYFSASGEGIFEISMTASEFTDTGEFVKYDPQAGGWE